MGVRFELENIDQQANTLFHLIRTHWHQKHNFKEANNRII